MNALMLNSDFRIRSLDTAINLRKQTDDVLLSMIKESVRFERKITRKILDQLREVDRRMLYVQQGYNSLFDFCTKVLGYSESAAYRRISAMRLLRDIPELNIKLENNEVTLSTLSQLSTFIVRLEKSANKKITDANKTALSQLIINKNQRQCEQALADILPMAIEPLEKERFVGNNLTEIKFYIDDKLREKVDRAREILSNVDYSMSYASLLDRLLEEFLHKYDGYLGHAPQLVSK